MKITTWNFTRIIVACSLLMSLQTITTTTQASSVRMANVTKRILMAMPYSWQKRTAIAMHAYPSLKENGTEWRLKLLLTEFYNMDNQQPFSYFVEEFIAIVNDNHEYFKNLLFTRVLKNNIPNKENVLSQILKRLELVKHSRNKAHIKAMLYIFIKRWLRKDTTLPIDVRAKKAFEYHVSFNRGRA